MDLGVLDGQIRGNYFLDSSFDPSVNQYSAGLGEFVIGLLLLIEVIPTIGKLRW